MVDQNSNSPELPAAVPALALASRDELHASLKPALSRGSFRNWINQRMKRDGFPRPVRVSGRLCLWRVAEVSLWLETRERGGRYDGKRHRPAPGTPFPKPKEQQAQVA